MSFFEVLNVFADLELRISRFYERLATLFASNLELSAFWDRMAADEIEHSEALKYAAQTLPEAARLTSDEQLIDPGFVDRVFRKIRACQEAMTRHENLLDAAFQCAIFLECSELSDIFQWLLEKIPVCWADTLSSLMGEAGDHIDSLCQAIEYYAQDRGLLDQALILRNQMEEYCFRYHMMVHKGRLAQALQYQMGEDSVVQGG